MVLAIACIVAALDWSTKALVAATVPLDGFVEVLPGHLAFWHVRNSAMILGLWGDLPLVARKSIAVVAALAAVVVLLQVVGRGHRLGARHRGWAWAFAGLALGGMLGNLGERVVHWGVTDFLSFAWGPLWLPPGNVADVALLLSAVLAVPVSVLEARARARRGASQAPPPPVSGRALRATPTVAEA